MGDPPAKDTASIFAEAKNSVASGNVEKSNMLGFSIIKTAFKQTPTVGALLVGFDLVLAKGVNEADEIYGLRPIYRTQDDNEVSYESFGPFTASSQKKAGKKGVREKSFRTVKVKARSGYAVAGLTLRSDIFIRGMSVTFMRIAGTSLDSKKTYASDWYGDRNHGPEGSVNSNGSAVVGVFGNQNEDRVIGLGLIYVKPSPVPPELQQPTVDPGNAARVELEVQTADPPSQPQAMPLARAPVVYKDAKRHYELELPNGWVEMSVKELEQIQGYIRQQGLDKKVQFEAGFRPRNSRLGTFPYSLVQVQVCNTSRMSYEDIEREFSGDLKGHLKDVQGTLGAMAKDISLDTGGFNRERNRIVIRSKLDVLGFGQVQGFSVSNIGSEAVVTVHCYAQEGDFRRKLGAFTDLCESFHFDEGFEFKPGTSVLEELRKGLAKWSVFVIAVVIGVISLVLLLFFVVKRSSASGYSPEEDREALY
ncbi:MAG: hypothetical protein ACJ8FY_00280 [Gemmataceae bacterium]